MICKVLAFDLNLDTHKLQSTLAAKACQTQSVFLTSLQSDVAKFLQEEGNKILLCQNKQIDDLICQNINLLSNEKSIIDEQAVLFDKDGQKILFLPLDEDWTTLFDHAGFCGEANKCCALKLFGMSKDKIDTALDGLSGQLPNFSASVIERGILKFDVYISYTAQTELIDEWQIKIAAAFKDFVYSDNGLEINQTVFALAALKGVKFAMCEGVTAGALASGLCALQNDLQSVLHSAKIAFCQEPTNADEVYRQTLGLFDGNDIFAINVQGAIEEGGLRIVYAIGNDKSIDVHKNFFKTGEREKDMQFALDAIMFNIIKKLRQNNLSF